MVIFENAIRKIASIFAEEFKLIIRQELETFDKEKLKSMRHAVSETKGKLDKDFLLPILERMENNKNKE